MQRSKAKQQVKKYAHNLQSCYNKVLEDFEPEQIHDFRLLVKKLNALLWLLNGKKPHGYLKLKKPFHQFYRALGNVRNLQLHQERVRNLCERQTLPLPLYYLQSLKEEEVKEKNAVREQALQLNTKKFFKKLCNVIPDVNPWMVESFTAANIAVLTVLLTQPPLQDEDLHEVRKILKRFLYTWPWIKTNLHQEHYVISLSKNACDTLAAKLGDFMDKHIALYFFEAPYSIDTANAEEITILHSLQAHVAAEKQRQYEDVTAALKNLLPVTEIDSVSLSLTLETVE